MAAFVNRTVSMMAGDGPHNRSTPNPYTDVRGLRNSADSSPLQIFVKAKKKINSIFVEIESYTLEALKFIEVTKSKLDVTEDKSVKQVGDYTVKVHGIKDVLSRDHMKVAFFGRTSNGKSSVINAMLRDKILPSGIGHTTNCFLQVEGSDSHEAYLMIEGSDDKKNVASVGQLAHALCKEKLCESQLVRIFWPRDKCSLLRDDVVFVDSPGVDVTPNLDEWIDKHCLDADVFVLVANAESTLMVTEKSFFHKVSSRLSKPNIFILNNRWDASANEPEYLDEVRHQHLERATDFLTNELKVCSLKEAEERIFFISAKEALRLRQQEQGEVPGSNFTEGFQTRYFEFEDFERKFEECISKSAVKTKFDQHSDRGKCIIEDIRSILDDMYNKCQAKKEANLVENKRLRDKMTYTEEQLVKITGDMKLKIQNIVADVEHRVSKALSDEIKRLAVLVDEFNFSFHPEPLVLNVYKKELHAHIENGLGSNLRAKLSTALHMHIDQIQKEMAERMDGLVQQQEAQKDEGAQALRPTNQYHQFRQPFEILYRLNCDNLCADFQEDLEFRFSWGLTTLIQRFAGSGASLLALKNARLSPDAAAPGGGALSPDYERNMSPYVRVPPRDDWSLLSSVALASIGAQGTVGGLVVAGFMFKTVGWRLIAISGMIYSCLYLYERLTWTNRAKERLFKKQYVQHATKKLRLIVDLTSTNCSHQVQQELSSTFARLCQQVDQATSSMDKDLKSIEANIRALDGAANSAKVLRNKANYLAHELDSFNNAFLRPNS